MNEGDGIKVLQKEICLLNKKCSAKLNALSINLQLFQERVSS